MFDNRFRIYEDGVGAYVKDEWTNIILCKGTRVECYAFFEGLRTGFEAWEANHA
ncbi:hypothetical protein K13PH07C1L_LOCUS23 [Klebsiella phage vB_Kpn_K13PH07C1L]|uniref:Uncharacterized protein n=1 Tax=Klebsiella phage vB_Kpn_K13PH07C1L TaxID=3071649 RepID=A0AAV1MFN1_9CAUD|nr:hypothetical protein K13PH07C1L_LOCUS23 [Klebsiella phage vB_Kpn_K13PH07C1L]CAK6604309.1 hypothetical protein K13PH07C1S_LOCUS22 [Klebsiella phage vB_Kpn_K13PH07C1S]